MQSTAVEVFMACLNLFHDTLTRLQQYRFQQNASLHWFSAAQGSYLMTQLEKKPQNIFLHENFHRLQRIKVFNLEILEKISWNMPLQSFYIRFLFLSPGLKWNNLSKQDSLNFFSLSKSGDTMTGERKLVLVSPDVWFFAWTPVFQKESRLWQGRVLAEFQLLTDFEAKNFIWIKL